MKQMGLTEDSDGAEFLPLHGNSRPIAEMYWKKFICAKKEDMRIYGDYNSN